MIGSFWNLCRACPSMPVDKLHSEYRSTYRWHEYTGPRQEVVRKPPQATTVEKSNDIHPVRTSDDDFHTESLSKLEPAMPRRKKYPDLAYRHHEFLVSDGVNGDCGSVDRARSEERGGANFRPSRRSKSEGPARNGVNDSKREREPRRESDPDVENMGKDTGLFRKAIEKISTEYRLQFAWPQSHISRRDATDSAPKKSQSMGALKANANAAMVHKKRMDLENKDASELEPLVSDRNSQDKPKEDFNSEYKKNYRPFTEYADKCVKAGMTNNIEENGLHHDDTEKDIWYRQVVALRKKAGEYKNRGWGSELATDRLSDLYNRQVELWDQVSRRSSLSALSLASMTHKSYTKEEKEEDNNKKSSPSKAYRNAENNARMIRDIIRHHLERTTGGSELDGLILSPTREKLEPTIPRKDDDSRGSQKNSPKKNSPMKSSSLKRTNQKATKVRSQSVGPITDSNAEKKSPKRQSRSATVKERKSSGTPSAKRPRPSSLNTTVSSRSKNSTVASKNEDVQLAKPNTKTQTSNDSSKQKVGAKDIRKGSQGADGTKAENTTTIETKISAEESQLDSLTYEPVIKSPPEPTRVKSPEQILMRSPDPVNWTVPLDTGKTFTVTQNVREGDSTNRPRSEVNAYTPPDIPPPVAQSAPPTLHDQNKEQGMA
ncbi:uncharacterized protein LOC109608782 isoform X2 [Aethina tumida]|uniref:uncharacterized protein LOC109608782 isoform X2 n=1 Tax=Aethina tumida TaxID=116153 RepID=UPI002147B486|nr:uncharacterized protein LOC109608782 isoform X2 [Aethina tumida]